MKFQLNNPTTTLDKYLVQVEEKESPGLITQAFEWILEGWGLGVDAFPEAEQIAAALFMEAKTQDSCVESGETHEDYPKQLRSIAHKILILAGHADPVLVDSMKQHIKFAAGYEQYGNTRASMQLRAVGNMLGSYIQGHSICTVVGDPNREVE